MHPRRLFNKNLHIGLGMPKGTGRKAEMQSPWRGFRRTKRSILLAVVGVLAGAGLVATSVTAAFATTTDITSTGPLTDIGISTDLNCSVNHTGDTAGEWFGNTACGTFLASAGTLYGPTSVPAGGSASPSTPWTGVSQSAVTGSGTSSDPYKIVTVDAAGTSGLQVTETDSYVVGQESYRNDVTVTNTGSTSATGILYRGGDCYLQNSDFGFGIQDSSTGAITCTTSLTPGSRIEQMLPLTAGTNYFEGVYNTLWANIGTQNAFPNTCDCSIFEDNSIGLSWGVSLGAGAVKTFSSIVTFSPLGSQPVTLTKAADASSVPAGASDGYTITATNSNAGPVTLATLTDTLGAGFSYQLGTTTGATTADPSISGQTLTWGSIVVPGGGTATLHFAVKAPTTPGTYNDDAEGTATGFTVVGTGAAAPVTVTGASLIPTTLSPNVATGDFADPTSVSAVLTNSNTSAAIAGKSIMLTLNGSETCTGTTDATGTATCSITPGEAAGTYTLSGSFAGDSTNASSTGSASFVVTLEQTALSYTGATSAVNGQPVMLSGVLTTDDPSAGTALSGKTVTFTLGTGGTAQTCTGTTDSSGTASCTIASVSQTGTSIPVASNFAGDTFYLPASASSTLSLTAATQPTKLRTSLSSGQGCSDHWSQGCNGLRSQGCGGHADQRCGGNGDNGHGTDSITVHTGTAVTDSATLSGANASTATGTVTYNVYSDSGCTTAVSTGTPETITTPDTLPDSSPVSLTTDGTYYWQASYSGDANNAASVSKCGSEIETVTPAPTKITTMLLGSGTFGGGRCWWLGDLITVFSGTSVTDSATLSGPNASSAGGTVTYTVYSDPRTKTVAADGGTFPVTNGSVPNSNPVTLSTEGTYYWQASYSGDALNAPSSGPWGSETEIVGPVPHCNNGWNWGFDGGCKSQGNGNGNGFGFGFGGYGHWW
jgi:hypothetical protein